MQAHVFFVSFATVLMITLGTLNEVSASANPCMILNYFNEATTAAPNPANAIDTPDFEKGKEKILETFFQKLMKWEPEDTQKSITKNESNNSEDKSKPSLLDKDDLESKSSLNFEMTKHPLKDLISNYVKFMTFIFAL